MFLLRQVISIHLFMRLYLFFKYIFLYNNPIVSLPLETRLAINLLGFGGSQKNWNNRGRKTGKKVKEGQGRSRKVKGGQGRSREVKERHNQDRHDLIPLLSTPCFGECSQLPVLNTCV